MLERHELEDIHRESEIYKQENAYYLMEQSGELQEIYLRGICELGEIDEEIEVYSDTYDTYLDIKYREVFDEDERRIIEKLIESDDEGIDCDKFIQLFDHNIIMYRDNNIKKNLERLNRYTDSIIEALGEL